MSKLVDEGYNISEKFQNSSYGKYYTEKANDFSEKVNNNSYISYFIVRVEPYSKALETRISPLFSLRWLFALSVLGYFGYNIVNAQGYYLVAYFEALYLLSLFNRYFPQFKPEQETLNDLESQDDVVIEVNEPLLNDEEVEAIEVNVTVKPRLTEFKIWKRTIISTMISNLLTNLEFLNIPVFWPILVGYFGYISFASILKRVKCSARVHRFITLFLKFIDFAIIFGFFAFQALVLFFVFSSYGKNFI